MATQHSHTSTPFVFKKFPIIVVCDGVLSPANVGALFRVCGALGIEKIIFCSTTIDFTSARLQRTSRSTHQKVPYYIKEDIVLELQKLKEAGYSLLALEVTDNSISLEKLKLTNKKVALVIGNEQQGISKAVLNYISQVIHIEMYGENSSMNVVQASGIALYSIVNKLKLSIE